VVSGSAVATDIRSNGGGVKALGLERRHDPYPARISWVRQDAYPSSVERVLDYTSGGREMRRFFHVSAELGQIDR
jgi:hypothetical protein